MQLDFSCLYLMKKNIRINFFLNIILHLLKNILHPLKSLKFQLLIISLEEILTQPIGRSWLNRLLGVSCPLLWIVIMPSFPHTKKTFPHYCFLFSQFDFHALYFIMAKKTIIRCSRNAICRANYSEGRGRCAYSKVFDRFPQVCPRATI